MAGLRVFSAHSFRARLLGLALLEAVPPDCALLIDRCSSVHTFGMRFPVDLLFLDEEGEVIRVEARVGPWRIVRCAGAAAVLETPARVPGAPERPPGPFGA